MKITKYEVDTIRNTAFYEKFKEYIEFQIAECKNSLILANDIIEVKKIQSKYDTFITIYGILK